MEQAPESAPQNSERAALLAAILPHANFDGWGRMTLRRAAQDLDMPLALAEDLFPRWPLDAILFHIAQADETMGERLRAETQAAPLGVRATLQRAIALRLAESQPHKEAIRRAVLILSQPAYLYAASRATWRSVDAMWALVGVDRGLDYYSKRSLLAGVYSSVLLRWFQDQSPDAEDTLAFASAQLDRVVAVMKPLGKLRARVKSRFAFGGRQ